MLQKNKPQGHLVGLGLLSHTLYDIMEGRISEEDVRFIITGGRFSLKEYRENYFDLAAGTSSESAALRKEMVGTYQHLKDTMRIIEPEILSTRVHPISLLEYEARCQGKRRWVDLNTGEVSFYNDATGKKAIREKPVTEVDIQNLEMTQNIFTTYQKHGIWLLNYYGIKTCCQRELAEPMKNNISYLAHIYS